MQGNTTAFGPCNGRTQFEFCADQTASSLLTAFHYHKLQASVALAHRLTNSPPLCIQLPRAITASPTPAAMPPPPTPPSTSSTPITPNPPDPSPEPGDPHWLRVMETKASQWRLINTLALHQLSHHERLSCTHLHHLSQHLDALVSTTRLLERLLAHLSHRRTHTLLTRVAAPHIARATAVLTNITPLYMEMMRRLKEEGGVRLEGPGQQVVGQGLGGELDRFRVCARNLRQRVVGVEDLEGVCDALESLALVVADVAHAVERVGDDIIETAGVSEVARVAVARHVVRMAAEDNAE